MCVAFFGFLWYNTIVMGDSFIFGEFFITIKGNQNSSVFSVRLLL
jgi:hypothetical protein